MGFARFCFRKAHTLLGTPEYMAPEVISIPHTHDRMADWWSFGVLVFELITGQLPWLSEDDSGELEDIIFGYRQAMDDGVPEQCYQRDVPLPAKDLVSQLLQVDPANRLGARQGVTEVRRHCWFKAVKFDFDALHAGRLKSPHTPEIVLPSNLDEDLTVEDDDLFVEYEDDGSGWDAAF